MRKSLDTGNFARDGLSGWNLQDGFFASELLLFLREVKCSKREFPADKPISDIKYYYLASENDILFYSFND